MQLPPVCLLFLCFGAPDALFRSHFRIGFIFRLTVYSCVGQVYCLPLVWHDVDSLNKANNKDCVQQHQKHSILNRDDFNAWLFAGLFSSFKVASHFHFTTQFESHSSRLFLFGIVVIHQIQLCCFAGRTAGRWPATTSPVNRESLLLMNPPMLHQSDQSPCGNRGLTVMVVD